MLHWISWYDDHEVIEDGFWMKPNDAVFVIGYGDKVAYGDTTEELRSLIFKDNSFNLTFDIKGEIFSSRRVRI